MVAAANSAVVLEYHHVARDTPPSTSVTPEMFARHMDYLADNDFHVWPLGKLVETIRSGGEVPERTVALAFDDGYRSVYHEVFPRLQKRGWPFAIFVTTGYIDDGDNNFVTWQQLREMSDAGVVIGNHTVTHPHMVRRDEGESDAARRARLRAEITDAQARLERELGAVSRLFAYPYGEFSPAVEAIVADLGFAGFGQQSGAFGRDSRFTALPRFPMATGFASLDTFAVKVRARPLPVRSTQPESGVLDAGAVRPEVRLHLDDGAYRVESVRCYVGGQPAQVRVDGQSPAVLSVQSVRPIGPGRTKYNCTAPATDADVWYWYSFLWMKPLPDGSWYRD